MVHLAMLLPPLLLPESSDPRPIRTCITAELLPTVFDDKHASAFLAKCQRFTCERQRGAEIAKPKKRSRYQPYVKLPNRKGLNMGNRIRFCELIR